jgi:hypothetical protein
MFNSPLNLIGAVLIVTALALAAFAFLRPTLFRKLDTLVIAAFLISGIILFSRDRLYDEFPQFILILLTVPAIFYAIENIRIRRNKTL